MGAGQDLIDVSPEQRYARNESEQLAYIQAKSAAIEDDSDSDEEVKGEESNEYIFLIDRSGSMYGNRVELAKRALMLFLYSLPPGSRFNVCSYGSRFSFLFPNERSVPYNDDTLREAVSQIQRFDANYGGTEIFKPLQSIFNMGDIPADCTTSHIYLLTDGAVWDVQKIIRLVASKSNMQQRVHTFGIGHGASEELIKQAAFKGFGQYYFIYNEDEIEERVVNALRKSRLQYQVMQHVRLFDAQR